MNSRLTVKIARSLAGKGPWIHVENKFNPNPHWLLVIQGADDKLGQFLDQFFRQRVIIEIFCRSH